MLVQAEDRWQANTLARPGEPAQFGSQLASARRTIEFQRKLNGVAIVTIGDQIKRQTGRARTATLLVQILGDPFRKEIAHPPKADDEHGLVAVKIACALSLRR